MNQTIHPNDDMFIGDHAHYAACGQQLADFGAKALELAPAQSPTFLELPCGYGRITRHLADRYDPKHIHVADIMKPSVDFCVQTFGVVGHYIEDPIYEFTSVPDDTFDVALMGSLITHLSEQAATTVMRSFFRKIKSGGIGVVTTHGVFSRKRHDEGDWYQVGATAQHELTSKYDADKFGFVPYDLDHSNEKKTVEYIGASYGISLIPEKWVKNICAELGLSIVGYTPGGWDDHQDVFLIRR